MAFHKSLLSRGVLWLDENQVPNNADKSNPVSSGIAKHIALKLEAEVGKVSAPQTVGADFEDIVSRFLEESFGSFQHLRPGKWRVQKVKGRGGREIARFAQYAHIAVLQEAAKNNPQLAAVLGNEYIISPDIVVTRDTEADESINREQLLVDGDVAARADLRSGANAFALLHASISTKWTIRSDRVQNTRAEALNLMRNRKGRQPHIVAVTAEPLPSRLCSLALGTGDIDCVYHFALVELIQAVNEVGNADSQEMLGILVDGKRLKDIADLPLDLAV